MLSFQGEQSSKDDSAGSLSHRTPESTRQLGGRQVVSLLYSRNTITPCYGVFYSVSICWASNALCCIGMTLILSLATECISATFAPHVKFVWSYSSQK